MKGKATFYAERNSLMRTGVGGVGERTTTLSVRRFDPLTGEELEPVAAIFATMSIQDARSYFSENSFDVGYVGVSGPWDMAKYHGDDHRFRNPAMLK